MKVPFNRATVAPRQIDYVAESFASERISGDGPFTQRCVDHLATELGTSRVALTPSCTAALEMSALLCEVGSGDEVIVPSFTFVSTANAFALFGATPVFVDVDAATGNVTVETVEAALTSRTKVVVIVHYGGRPADVAAIAELCRDRGVLLVEDCAHALYARAGGRALGTFGDLATFSFHETKNISCGEGGCIVVNRESMWERALVVREKGTDRTRFLQGHVDKYTWVDVGSSYLLADPLAAVLASQFDFRDTIAARRSAAEDLYRARLADWATDNGVMLPEPVDAGDVASHHLFPLVFPTTDIRDRFMDHCRDGGVGSVFHYLPLHDSAVGRRLAPGASCPDTVSLSSRLARIPLFSDITEAESHHVVDVVGRFAP